MSEVWVCRDKGTARPGAELSARSPGRGCGAACARARSWRRPRVPGRALQDGGGVAMGRLVTVSLLGIALALLGERLLALR